MATLRFAVADGDAGSRLDRVLWPHGRRLRFARSRSACSQTGAVTVDGASRPKSHRLEPGSVVVVELPVAAAGLSSEPVTVQIAYEDEHLVVVDKPAGMTMHPGAGRDSGTLAGQLAHARRGGRRRSRIGPESCIGSTATPRGFSSSRARRTRSTCSRRRFARREVERRYLALVKGHPRSRTGRIDAPIGRDRRDPTKRSLDTEEPREAVTWFEVDRDAARAHASRRQARDRKDTSDPRAPRRDRPSRQR